MITYENDMKIVFQFTGSVFPRTIPWAIISAAVSLCEKLLPEVWEGALGKAYAHQVFSISVGFLLVFRAGLSYGRFWEGRSAINVMTSKWLDACNQVVAYDRITQDPKAIQDAYLFVRSQVHLFSLLHALALQVLQEDNDLAKIVNEAAAEEPDEFGHCETLMVLGGITPQELALLSEIEGRPYQVMCWIQRDILLRHKAGGMSVPPPILSRCMQAMSDGFNAFENAAKIQDTLFPFPYAQLLNGLLLVFALSTPIAVSAFTDSIIIAVALSSLATMGVIALEEVAKEIENPYGDDPNDLPLSTYQLKFNTWTKQLLDEAYVIQKSGQHLPDLETTLLSLAVGAPAAPPPLVSGFSSSPSGLTNPSHRAARSYQVRQ
eukprot:CAMPEP_0114546480 /NCGR_PEP_ID=MMETSP0114-20121206/3957_1 /TAXON_ID=31324 /ORGANISM="Goniomonas sp, Strain m" /LENGTH=376 /DNA_ID=CAMNT_0001730979 /DNA_START=45 /DNA_END=1175 /DNA_ORIENTATION=-